MRLVLFASVALLFSCAEPVCGCTPIRSGMVLGGTLVSQSATPLPGRRVRAEIGVGTCSTFLDSYASAVTDPAGRLTLALDAPGVDSVCVRLFARDTVAGAVEWPLVGPLRLPGGRRTWDTLMVSLVLAP
jgi:hypothetical protein